MSPYQHLISQREAHLAVITLNRPQRRNALSLELMQELIRCLDEIAESPEIRAVILAAAGKVFCSGHDLSEMTGRNINEYRHIFDVCTRLMEKI
jgi:enoyl-CoA hydratase/carnithine racemase